MEDHIRYDAAQEALVLLDQRLLPAREEFFVCRTSEDLVTALAAMVVRGAPAIGIAAAWGCVLAALEVLQEDDWRTALARRLERIASARPTAVNLRWAVERMRRLWTPDLSCARLAAAWRAQAAAMQRQDIFDNRALGTFGAQLIPLGACIMTHCNAGALATAGYGTALGVIRAAWERDKNITVIANETRPFLQGARLTAYELAREGIPVRVACDNACALLMQRGLVGCVVLGADRIAANGDTANKIGTYGVALLAHEHGIPFYVAAPLSTLDPDAPDGAAIPIEEREAREVTHVGDAPITPDGVPVYNFAFDVTPARLITAIITDKGVLRAPYGEAIKKVLAQS
ncbi:MAG: S-methyl-5-thioribose-1-phosphate isomerase [Deltaproteobacteria bacterium]|jgi:methylthioribose-1-phosphate isomerase|nr:S-methyl-5-thioribose-1-phosphate isomerase [Deltaproteobacteria bacterium]